MNVNTKPKMDDKYFSKVEQYIFTIMNVKKAVQDCLYPIVLLDEARSRLQQQPQNPEQQKGNAEMRLKTLKEFQDSLKVLHQDLNSIKNLSAYESGFHGDMIVRDVILKSKEFKVKPYLEIHPIMDLQMQRGQRFNDTCQMEVRGKQIFITAPSIAGLQIILYFHEDQSGGDRQQAQAVNMPVGNNQAAAAPPAALQSNQEQPRQANQNFQAQQQVSQNHVQGGAVQAQVQQQQLMQNHLNLTQALHQSQGSSVSTAISSNASSAGVPSSMVAQGQMGAYQFPTQARQLQIAQSRSYYRCYDLRLQYLNDCQHTANNVIFLNRLQKLLQQSLMRCEKLIYFTDYFIARLTLSRILKMQDPCAKCRQFLTYEDEVSGFLPPYIPQHCDTAVFKTQKNQPNDEAQRLRATSADGQQQRNEADSNQKRKVYHYKCYIEKYQYDRDQFV